MRKKIQVIQSMADLNIVTLQVWGFLMIFTSCFYILAGTLDIIPMEISQFWAGETRDEAYLAFFNMIPNLLKN